MRIKKISALPIRVKRDLPAATGLAGSPTALGGESDYRWSLAYPALYSIHFETALVRITTECGKAGWGEAQAPLAPQVACTIIDCLLRPILEGEDFEPTREGLTQLWTRMYSTMRVRGQTGGFMLDAISGVDLALWDLVGKATSQSVAKLIEPVHKTKIEAYLSGLPGEDPKARVEHAKPYLNEGFRIFKLYYDRTAGELLDTIDALQTQYPGLQIAVDALWRFSPGEAIAFGQQLDARQVRWFECPLLPEYVAEHATLAKEIKTPIAIGESYRTRHELRGFYEARSAGVLQPDLGRSGLTETVEIAQEASKCGMEVVPHVSIACGPQIAAAMQFAAAISNCNLLEFNPRVLEFANRFLQRPLVLKDAHYLLPEEPGLGIDVAEIPADYVLSGRNTASV